MGHPTDVEELKAWVQCPRCKGIGVEIEIRAHFRCGLCEGRGVVPIRVCKGCGLPAFEDSPVDYCGRPKCLELLVFKCETLQEIMMLGEDEQEDVAPSLRRIGPMHPFVDLLTDNTRARRRRTQAEENYEREWYQDRTDCYC